MLDPNQFMPAQGGQANPGSGPLEEIMASAQKIMQICSDLAGAMAQATQGSPVGPTAPSPEAGPVAPSDMESM